MNFQLQSDVTKLRQVVVADPLAGPAGPTVSGGGTAGGSPFAAQQQQQQQHGSRPDGASPGPTMEDSTAPSSAPPSRAPSGGGGILLLNRTTTGSAAALARNNSRTVTRPDMFTPPPAPRFPPGAGASHGQGPSPGPAPAGSTPSSVKAGVLTPPSASRAPQHDFLDLATPESTPGPSEPRLTPVSCPPMDDGLVIVMRGGHQTPDLKLPRNAVRNQVWRAASGADFPGRARTA
jgi:kinesin family protein 5